MATVTDSYYYNHGDQVDRIAARVGNFDDCWEWTGHIAPNGYGAAGKGWAHRIVWEALVGSIPEGLTIDHLCRNRRCVNPDHLEPVTQLENNRRGKGTVGRTHCVHGHALTPDNVYIVHSPDYTRRKCRTCQLANSARQRARKGSNERVVSVREVNR